MRGALRIRCACRTIGREPSFAIAILAATFVVHLALDHLLASRSGLPPWYLKMRQALTAAVVVALVVAFAAPV